LTHSYIAGNVDTRSKSADRDKMNLKSILPPTFISLFVLSLIYNSHKRRSLEVELLKYLKDKNFDRWVYLTSNGSYMPLMARAYPLRIIKYIFNDEDFKL
jgi:hypothetical protein